VRSHGVQRDFFNSDRDELLRQLVKKRDSLAAELTAAKQQINELTAELRGHPVVPDGSVLLAKIDNPNRLMFYSADRKTTLVVWSPLLLEALRKLGHTPEL